ncbi:MAG: hypothetical protein ABRQ27_02965 [Clostridiaceae bacterium]
MEISRTSIYYREPLRKLNLCMLISSRVERRSGMHKLIVEVGSLYTEDMYF